MATAPRSPKKRTTALRSQSQAKTPVTTEPVKLLFDSINKLGEEVTEVAKMVDRVVTIVESEAARVEMAPFRPSPESLRVMRDFMAESEAGMAPKPMNGESGPVNIAQQAQKVGPVLEGLIQLDRLVGTVWSAVADLSDRLAPISSHSPQPGAVPEYPRIPVEEGSPEALKHIAAIHSQLISVLDRVEISKQELAI